MNPYEERKLTHQLLIGNLIDLFRNGDKETLEILRNIEDEKVKRLINNVECYLNDLERIWSR